MLTVLQSSQDSVYPPPVGKILDELKPVESARKSDAKVNDLIGKFNWDIIEI